MQPANKIKKDVWYFVALLLNKIKMEITYLKGDATNPVAVGNKIIVHVCNDIGYA